MNTKNLIDGINILMPYYDKPNGYHVGCEHDQFYMYPTDRPVSPEDVQKLHALGWFQEGIDDEEAEAAGEHSKRYEPEESWSALV